MRCFLQLLSMLCSPSSWKMWSLKAISWCAIIGKMPSSSSSFSCFDSLSPSLSHLYWKKLHFVVSFWQNCTTPPFGISLGWTSIILGCIPKHRKKFGRKISPSNIIHLDKIKWSIFIPVQKASYVKKIARGGWSGFGNFFTWDPSQTFFYVLGCIQK